MYEKETDRALHLAREPGKAELEFVDASRTVLREFVWGVLIRSRIFCEGCGVASDKIYYDHGDILKLGLACDGPACRLEQLICRFRNLTLTISCSAQRTQLYNAPGRQHVLRGNTLLRESRLYCFCNCNVANNVGVKGGSYKIMSRSLKFSVVCAQEIIISRLLFVIREHMFFQDITV